MSFKTPILCDRRVYAFKGSWRNPQEDIDSNIFYYIKEQPTIVPAYINGREELKETLIICVFGSKPFAKNDIVVLDNGSEYLIQQIIPNPLESNILVRDMLKPRYESTDLVLG